MYLFSWNLAGISMGASELREKNYTKLHGALQNSLDGLVTFEQNPHALARISIKSSQKSASTEHLCRTRSRWLRSFRIFPDTRWKGMGLIRSFLALSAVLQEASALPDDQEVSGISWKSICTTLGREHKSECVRPNRTSGRLLEV